MSDELFDRFLEAHPEWDDMLTKVAEEKVRCEKAGEHKRAMAWLKIENALYKAIEDEAIEWSSKMTKFDCLRELHEGRALRRLLYGNASGREGLCGDCFMEMLVEEKCDVKRG